MKCILSYRVAKHLLAEGCRIKDIDTSHKVKGNIVFIFEDTPELQDAMDKLPKRTRVTKQREER